MKDLEPYPILQVTENDVIEREHLEAKTKFWVNLKDSEEEDDWLFKIPVKIQVSIGLKRWLMK